MRIYVTIPPDLTLTLGGNDHLLTESNHNEAYIKIYIFACADFLRM